MVNAIPAFIKRNKFFIFSFVMTIIFYFPALNKGSKDAGFIYMGDNIGFYLPSLAKTQSLLSSFNFTALDFSSFNGSSDFFLAANFFALHPLVVLFSLLVPINTSNILSFGQFFVIMCAVHTFIACYFSAKLLSRFFFFEFGASALVATIFSFSNYMVCALGEAEYLFSICIFPWAAYWSLAYLEKPDIRRLLLACLPIISGILGGYIPLALAALSLAVILIATKIFVWDNSTLSLNKRAHSFLWAMVPFMCSAVILSPYLYALHEFLNNSPSAGLSSIFYSAHQLAENPQSILRLFSFHLSVPGTFYEFSIYWGLIPLSIMAIFFSNQQTMQALSPLEWKLFKIAAVLYFLTILSIFGDYSVVSDLIYYFVPQIGRMHIYQRFLVPMSFFFGIIIAIMLKTIIEIRPFNATRNVLIVMALFVVLVAYLVGHNPVITNEIGINGYIIIELLLAVLFLLGLLTPGKTFIYSITVVLLTLPALNLMYNYSLGSNTYREQLQRLSLVLDKNEQQKLVSYLKQFGDKKIIKYVDITPRWMKDGGTEYFPKSFPYFVLSKIQLSSYTGFNFYLSARRDYMLNMPILGQKVALAPDWDMAKATGADFVVALKSDVLAAPPGSILAKIRSNKQFDLPHDVVIVPLLPFNKLQETPEDVVFDNGYFRVLPHTFVDDDKLINVAKGKTAHQSSTFGGAEAKFAVDGIIDGNFGHGSVTHTERDKNAWLEIDLGSEVPIDNLTVWNRTDCCSDRLNDYWVFISQVPFLPDDTVSTIESRADNWTHHVQSVAKIENKIRVGGIKGRYVRVQFGGEQPTSESFLSLAELEVFSSPASGARIGQKSNGQSDSLLVKEFKTNNANYLHLELQSSAPASVQYLFWKNPRLSFYLNGNKARLVKREGVPTINIPAGNNIIEVRYFHPSLALFWIFYALYAVSLLVVFIIPSNILDKFNAIILFRVRSFTFDIRKFFFKWKNEIALNLRYGIAGICNGIVSLSTIWILSKIGVGPIKTNIIGFSLGIIVAFLMSRNFVFRSNGHISFQAIKYIIAFVISYLVNLVILQICISEYSFDALIAQGCAISSYVVLMYLASRFFIFRESKI